MSDSVEIYHMPTDIAHLEAPPFVKVIACSIFMNVMQVPHGSRNLVYVRIPIEDLTNPWGVSEEMVELVVRWLTDIDFIHSCHKYTNAYHIRWGKPVPTLHFAKAYSHNTIAENTGTEPF